MNSQPWAYKPARLATSAVLAVGVSLGSASALAPAAQAAPLSAQGVVFPATMPTVSNLTSTGVGTTPQTATYTLQVNEEITLLDGNGASQTSVTLDAAQGTYDLGVVGSTATLTFTPILGYSGTASPVSFKVTDSTTPTDTTTATYTPTVTKPAAPTSANVTSTGIEGATQTKTVTPPTSGKVQLVDDADQVITANTVTVASKGTFTVVPTTGVITFVPVAGYTSNTAVAKFKVVDAYNTASTSSYTYTPTVNAAPVPVAADTATAGLGTQYADITLSADPVETIKLLDATGAVVATNEVSVAGKGTFRLYPAQDTNKARIVFIPAAGYTGDTAKVTYQLTNSYTKTDTGIYTPTVQAIANKTSTGGATQVQTAEVAVPADSTVVFVDNSTFPATTTTSVTRAGQGAYTRSVTGTTATLTFTPASLYVGTPGPVTYEVTDSFGNKATATYAPTVTPLVPLTKSGPTGGAITQTVTGIPSGGSITLVDALGANANSVTVLGKGTYALTYTSGQTSATIAFTPIAGFVGAAPAVTFKITEGAASLTSTYTATVTAPVLANPTALTSTGNAPAAQTSGGDPITVPVGGTVALLDATDKVVPSGVYAIAGKGTFVLLASSGRIVFLPDAAYTGSTAVVKFQVTDSYGQKASSTYTPTVNKPAAPTVADITSSATGAVAQGNQVSVPTGTTLKLLDGAGQPTTATTVTVADKGEFVLNPVTAFITFTPVASYSGSTATVGYVVTDAYGQSDQGVYTPTVNLPSAPTAAAKTSTGVGAAVQTVTVTPPTGGKVQLVDNSDAPITSNTSTVPGKGTFAVVSATGVITFTPAAGYSGATAVVKYQVVDAYAQASASATYTPTVTVPAAPTPVDRSTLGQIDQAQVLQLKAREGWALTLLNPVGGAPATTVTVANEGTYVVNTIAWTITFTPVAGYVGTATPISFRVTDAYAQSGTAAYAPVVFGALNDTFTATAGGSVRMRVLSNDVLAPQATWAPRSIRLYDGANQRTLASWTTGAGTWQIEADRNTLAFKSNGTKGTFWMRYLAKDSNGTVYLAKAYVTVS